MGDSEWSKHMKKVSEGGYKQLLKSLPKDKTYTVRKYRWFGDRVEEYYYKGQCEGLPMIDIWYHQKGRIIHVNDAVLSS